MSAPPGPIRQVINLPFQLLRYTSEEPILAGGLLWLLTRAPPHVRERVLGPLRSNLLKNNADKRIDIAKRVLKACLYMGIWRRFSQFMDRLAMNYWYLFSKPGAPWKFGDAQKSELVLITGASSGFGYQLVKSFAGKARVIALDMNELPSELARLPDVHFYKCDVTDFDALLELTDEIKSTHGNPSVLINNAGIANGKLVLTTPLKDVDRLMRVNLTSHFGLIREFLPGMLEQKKGHIVTVASMASFVAAPGLLDYCCSKVGALYLNDGLRAELFTRHGPAGHGIRTTSVHPSWHSTGITRFAEPMLAKAGIYPDPASNVTDLIVEQVLAGRSGQICVPKNQERLRNLRAWPTWMQDLLYGYPYRDFNKGFRLGDDDGVGQEGVKLG